MRKLIDPVTLEKNIRADVRLCPGGIDCTCCRRDCTCGCRYECPVFRRRVRWDFTAAAERQKGIYDT